MSGKRYCFVRPGDFREACKAHGRSFAHRESKIQSAGRKKNKEKTINPLNPSLHIPPLSRYLALLTGRRHPTLDSLL
jgi:hypothetical protein